MRQSCSPLSSKIVDAKAHLGYASPAAEKPVSLGEGSDSGRRSKMRELAYLARIAIFCIATLVAVGGAMACGPAPLGGAAAQPPGRATGTPVVIAQIEGTKAGKSAQVAAEATSSQSCFDGCRAASTQCNNCVSAPGPFCGPGEDACIASCNQKK